MRYLQTIGLAFLAVLIDTPAGAVTTADGVVLINQNAAIAGSLTPGDTPGFPIEIKVGGSYRLSSDLVVPANENGIYVTARNVTIDLNGFTIRGGNIARNGIRTIMSGLTVMNGTIQFFTQDAIYAAGPQLYVERTKLLNNGRYGINEVYSNANPRQLEDDGNTIIKSNIIMKNGIGVMCQATCHVEGNIVSHSGGYGVVIASTNGGGTVINNTINYNGNVGVVGHYLGLGGNTIINNAVCHTSGVAIKVMERNNINPETIGEQCLALPGN